MSLSENYYERLDSLVDAGFYPESAYEIKCKMSSRQRFWEKAGMKNVDILKITIRMRTSNNYESDSRNCYTKNRHPQNGSPGPYIS